MNYRHAFHAGNFADVFKHAVLALLLRALNAKDKPYCYIETHAGSGRYDLSAAPAQKTGEWRDGIGRLWEKAAEFAELADYLAAVRALNRPDRPLRFYPGSPLLAQALLRATDRLVLCELAPEEAEQLARSLGSDRRALVRLEDGYAALKALLPPPERRGLVLIDPSYERPAEFGDAADALIAAHARWPTGVYALWYPIKERSEVARLHRRLAASGLRRLLVAELSVYPEDSAFRLNGCGLLIANPPWQLDQSLGLLLPRLLGVLRQSPAARAACDWLVPE